MFAWLNEPVPKSWYLPTALIVGACIGAELAFGMVRHAISA